MGTQRRDGRGDSTPVTWSCSPELILSRGPGTRTPLHQPLCAAQQCPGWVMLLVVLGWQRGSWGQVTVFCYLIGMCLETAGFAPQGLRVVQLCCTAPVARTGQTPTTAATVKMNKSFRGSSGQPFRQELAGKERRLGTKGQVKSRFPAPPAAVGRVFMWCIRRRVEVSAAGLVTLDVTMAAGWLPPCAAPSPASFCSPEPLWCCGAGP